MAQEPSYKRKRVAIDHAQAKRRRDGRPLEPAAPARPGRTSLPEPGGYAPATRVQRHGAQAAPRRTRIPYAEHGTPRPARQRAATAQHARLAQGRQVVAFQDEPFRHGQRGQHAHGGQRAQQAPQASQRPRGHQAASQDIVLQTPPMGGSARVLNPNAPLVPAWAKLALLLVAVVALVWAGTRLASCIGQGQPDELASEPEAPAISTSRLVEERLASYGAYEDPSPVDLDALPAGTDVSGFALSGQQGVDAPVLGDESRAAIDAAMAPFVEDGFDVGFVLMDIGTGRGFACNVDEPIYGASSFKGPYCAYVAESYVDSGEVAIAEVSDSFFNAVVYSDNGTYDALRERFSDARLATWLESLGADAQIAYDTWYPTYTARDSARLWLAAYEYLQGTTSAAEQLRSDFSQTKTSFMRTAVTDADDAGETAMTEAAEAVGEGASEEGQIAVTSATLGTAVGQVLSSTVEAASADEVSVMDKAGWYPRDADDIPAIVDAGIVTCNGRDYLLCVMTDMPWTEPNQETAEALIAAVFAARNDLG